MLETIAAVQNDQRVWTLLQELVKLSQGAGVVAERVRWCLQYEMLNLRPRSDRVAHAMARILLIALRHHRNVIEQPDETASDSQECEPEHPAAVCSATDGPTESREEWSRPYTAAEKEAALREQETRQKWAAERARDSQTGPPNVIVGDATDAELQAEQEWLAERRALDRQAERFGERSPN